MLTKNLDSGIITQNVDIESAATENKIINSWWKILLFPNKMNYVCLIIQAFHFLKYGSKKFSHMSSDILRSRFTAGIFILIGSLRQPETALLEGVERKEINAHPMKYCMEC